MATGVLTALGTEQRIAVLFSLPLAWEMATSPAISLFHPEFLSANHCASSNQHAPRALLSAARPSFSHFFIFFVFPATLPASHLYYEELILFLHSINNRLLIRIIMESQMAAEQHRGGCGE